MYTTAYSDILLLATCQPHWKMISTGWSSYIAKQLMVQSTTTMTNEITFEQSKWHRGADAGKAARCGKDSVHYH